MEKLSLKEVQEHTAKLLNLTIEDVSYITEDFLSLDFQEFDASKNEGKLTDIVTPPDVFRGHNVAYGRRNNRSTYEFISGQYGCSTSPLFCYQNEYNHYIYQYCGSVHPRNLLVHFRRS